MSAGPTLRRATPADAGELARLVSHPDVRPYLAVVRPSTEEELALVVAAAESDPEGGGVLLVERDGATVGTASYAVVNRRSRIADLHSLAVHPGARGGGTARTAVGLVLDLLFGDLGMHRVEAEVYGFNSRAAAFLASVGFTEEGRRRRAYLREDGWVDGIRFGLLQEEWAVLRAGRDNGS